MTVTVWGVIDGHSWLQSQNNVGGASNGKNKQCPLLFDDDYKAKPCFYALCDEDMPVVKKSEEVTTEEVADTAVEEAVDADIIAEEEDSPTVVEVKENHTVRNAISGAIVVVIVVICAVFAKKRKK